MVKRSVEGSIGSPSAENWLSMFVLAVSASSARYVNELMAVSKRSGFRYTFFVMSDQNSSVTPCSIVSPQSSLPIRSHLRPDRGTYCGAYCGA